MNYKANQTKSGYVYNIITLLTFITVFPKILCTNWYSEFNYEKSIKFLQNFISGGDLVFDVGANIGGKTDLYLACNAKVICFEPQTKCIEQLYKKFKNNTNAIIVPKGLAEKPGYINLFPCNQVTTIATCSRDWTINSRFVEQGYSWAKPVKIEVTTLDAMIEKYGLPMFCKIDVEGFEYNVLSGLTHPIPLISFEFTYEKKSEAKKCLDLLTKLGYKKFNFVAGETAFFFFNECSDANILLERIYKENICGTDLWGDIYAIYN